MKIVVSNNSRISSAPSRITVNNVNNVGRVTFGKIAKVGSVQLAELSDVTVSNPQEGEVLVYQANTNTYVVKTLPSLDGGIY
jgi:hypothetical protein